MKFFGVEVLVRLRNFKGIEKFLRGIEKFQGVEKYCHIRVSLHVSL